MNPITHPIIISLDGNIGSGKSTLLDQLKEKRKDYHYVDEPVEEWQSMTNESNENLLELFYKDQVGWSYKFQNYAYITRLNRLKKAINEGHKIIICERSIFTDKNIFAKMLHEDGKLSKIEYDMYNSWFDSFKIDITGVIYLQTSPEICNTRIQNRNRDGESNIPIEYLTRLHENHETTFTNKDDTIVLNGNDNFITNEQYLNQLINKIDDFVSKLNRVAYI